MGRGVAFFAPASGASLAALAAWVTARRITSLGHFETLDAVEYALTRAPGSPLGLIVYSMGASVAVVADSPFASERGLVRSLSKKQIGPLALPVGTGPSTDPLRPAVPEAPPTL